MQTILGANGTIARDLAKELRAFTNDIRLVSRNPKPIHPEDQIFPADLTEKQNVYKAVKGSEVVYVTVGFEYNINVWRKQWPGLIQHVIDACVREGSRLVFFDNMYCYDPTTVGHMTEENPIKPVSEKGKVRAQVAGLIESAMQEKNLKALIARSADFYGPGNEKSFLIETVYKNLKKGKSPQWFSNADKIHSFTYTPDAARATALLGNTSDAYQEVWHLPTDGQKLTGRQIAALFMQEMNIQKNVSVLPMWMIKTLGLFIPFLREMPEMMYQYNQDYFFDSSKFEKRFNVKPTPYIEGIRAIIQSDTQ